MKTVKVFGKSIPLLAIVAIIAIVGIVSAGIYATLILGPTVVTEPVIPPAFTPVITSTYENVVGSSATRGVIYNFDVRTANLGELPSSNNVYECVTIEKTGGGIELGDITIKYHDGTEYVEFILTDEGDTLTGIFPPEEGYIMTVGYDETVPFQATFNTVGTYTATLTIEDAV